MTRAGRPTQTSPQAWAQAALDEIEQRGVRGLSVQAVARRLGVSKGGAYHHYADRQALLIAALDLWEQEHVEDLARRFAAISDPRARLEQLLHHAVVELQPTILAQLIAAADNSDVAATLERAAAGRLSLLEITFRELGLPRGRARDRASLTYAAYLGLAQLRRQAPGRLDTSRANRSYLDDVLAVLITPR